MYCLDLNSQIHRLDYPYQENHRTVTNDYCYCGLGFSAFAGYMTSILLMTLVTPGS